MSSFAGAMVCADGPGGTSLLCRRRDPTLPCIGQYERVEPSDRSSQHWTGILNSAVLHSCRAPAPGSFSSRTGGSNRGVGRRGRHTGEGDDEDGDEGEKDDEETGRQVRRVPRRRFVLGYCTIDLYG